MSPATTLPVAIAVGVAGAVAVVIFQSTVADVLGGAPAIGAMMAVTWPAIRLAGETEASDEGPL
jgi:hypothetical protein